jgi:hypothetical protein
MKCVNCPPAHAQEISFWLNLERALLRIQEKRESVEVALTLDILKHGKRFHATVRYTLTNSVPDPNPDPHVFGPPGSGSISQRYGSGSSIINQKTLIPTVCDFVWTFYL